VIVRYKSKLNSRTETSTVSK